MFIKEPKYLMRKKGIPSLALAVEPHWMLRVPLRCESITVKILFKYDDLKGGEVFITNDVPHFITIPTTAGTGSEVGRSAIISDDETHQKKILFSPRLLARIVFADPLLTMDLPPFITAATGMDALTHNMEAFLVNMFHPMCDGIALRAISLIQNHW